MFRQRQLFVSCDKNKIPGKKVLRKNVPYGNLYLSYRQPKPWSFHSSFSYCKTKVSRSSFIFLGSKYRYSYLNKSKCENVCYFDIHINPLLEIELFNEGQKILTLECIPKGSIEKILACMDREKSLTNNTYKLLPGSARDTTALHTS